MSSWPTRYVLLIVLLALVLPAACRPVAAPGQPALPASAPASTLAAVDGASAPATSSFAVEPNTGLAAGEAITITWQAQTDNLQLCMIGGRGPTACEPVPPSGQKAITVTGAMTAMLGIGLSADGGSTIFAMQNLNFACLDHWYFANPQPVCPQGPAGNVQATWQPFEHGFLLETKAPDRLYALFEDHTFFFTDDLSGATGTDLLSPLGSATAPATTYTAQRQCELVTWPGMWACYLQAPDSRVLHLRPDSTAQVHFLWDWQ